MDKWVVRRVWVFSQILSVQFQRSLSRRLQACQVVEHSHSLALLLRPFPDYPQLREIYFLGGQSIDINLRTTAQFHRYKYNVNSAF